MNTPIWLAELLENPRVTDVCLNGCEQVFYDQGLGLELIPNPNGVPRWREEEMKGWVLDQLSRAGKSWDARHPFMDASLESGHRIHVTFPPIARNGILLSLRKLPVTKMSTELLKKAAVQRWAPELLENPNAFSPYSILVEAIEKGDSILISGATGSGKTTLANDLLGKVPSHERIIALEDTSELAPAHPHFLSLTSRPPNADGFGEVTLRTLLRQTLRMRPDRIILGECRGPEVLELLQALNTGHHGALATLHANSPREALRRIELLCLLSAGGVLPLIAIRELLALGIQWMVQVERKGPVRSITEIWKVEGREGDTILMRPVLNKIHAPTVS